MVWNTGDKFIVNITPICVQNRNPLQVIPLTFHHAEAQTQRPENHHYWQFSGCMGEEKVSNAAHDVVSQEVCARGAGVVQHPDALTQLHAGAIRAAARCPVRESLSVWVTGSGEITPVIVHRIGQMIVDALHGTPAAVDGLKRIPQLGSVLICTVMLADRFLFTLQDGFVLTTAIISAVLLTIGIRVVKRHNEENQN